MLKRKKASGTKKGIIFFGSLEFSRFFDFCQIVNGKKTTFLARGKKRPRGVIYLNKVELMARQKIMDYIKEIFLFKKFLFLFCQMAFPQKKKNP